MGGKGRKDEKMKDKETMLERYRGTQLKREGGRGGGRGGRQGGQPEEKCAVSVRNQHNQQHNFHVKEKNPNRAHEVLKEILHF